MLIRYAMIVSHSHNKDEISSCLNTDFFTQVLIQVCGQHMNSLMTGKSSIVRRALRPLLRLPSFKVDLAKAGMISILPWRISNTDVAR